MNDLTIAENFAMKKHRCQLRKDCETPYFYHLKQVVERLKKFGITDQDILCAGWLHDTIEDTDTDYDDIEKNFSRRVANIVSAVTKETRLPKPERERKYHIQLKKSSWESKVVKLGDIIANISDLENSNYTLKEKIKETEKKLVYFNIIRTELIKNRSKIPGLDKAENELNKLLKKYKQEPITLH